MFDVRFVQRSLTLPPLLVCSDDVVDDLHRLEAVALDLADTLRPEGVWVLLLAKRLNVKHHCGVWEGGGAVRVRSGGGK